MAQTPTPSLAIVIVNYRTADYTIRCVESLAPERALAGPFEVIVVDGGSVDGSAEKLTERFAAEPWRDWVSVLPLEINGGFGWANNQAMLRLLQRKDAPEFIYLLNPDTVIEPGAVKSLLDIIQTSPRIGAVGSRLIEPDGAPTGSAFSFPGAGWEFLGASGIPGLGKLFGLNSYLMEADKPRTADWLTGASVLFRSAALRECGLFDDGFFLYFEEIELIHRLGLAGWERWFVPDSRIIHVGGAATGVVSGQQVHARARPIYYFESRRRYYMLTGGATGLVAANLSWLTGRLLGFGVQLIRGRRNNSAPRELSMTLKHGFWPTGKSSRPSPARWDEPPGRMPSWMQP